MRAELKLRERYQLGPRAFAELVVWNVPRPVRGSMHDYKYRLAYVVGERCVVRFDNEAAKGDHKHVGETETPYRFTGPSELLRDFWEAIDAWDMA